MGAGGVLGGAQRDIGGVLGQGILGVGQATGLGFMGAGGVLGGAQPDVGSTAAQGILGAGAARSTGTLGSTKREHKPNVTLLPLGRPVIPAPPSSKRKAF